MKKRHFVFSVFLAFSLSMAALPSYAQSKSQEKKDAKKQEKADQKHEKFHDKAD